jgi:3-hydroxyisobutyrate dehydrogenase
MAQIGFIGLGHMGNPMARNLLKAGHTLKVYDVVPEAMQALKAHGALLAATPAEAANGADLVFTMLQTGDQVLKTCLGEQGVFSALSPSALYIDSSSIEIKVTQQLHQEAKSRKLAMLDAPVSGGVAGAEAATLTIMVGGEEEAFEKAKPFLALLGKKWVHAGAGGNGQAAKICNNLILGISMIAVCEGFSLAEKLNLDLKKFFEISSNASGQCWSMTSYCPAPGVIEKSPANQDYQPGFMAKMMLKDLRLAQQAAAEAQALIPLGEEAAELYSQFINQGNGELDFSGIMKLIKGEIKA